MGLPPNVIFVVIGPLVVIGLLMVAAMAPHGPSEYVTIGYLLGTIYGHTTLSAASLAIGVYPLAVRLPAAALWLAGVVVALTIGLGWNAGPDAAVFVIAGLVVGQWLLVQLPFWGLALFYGLKLRHFSEALPTSSRRDHQFGIRQVMIVTAIVGVVLGIGRVLVTTFAASFEPQVAGGEWPICIFLAVAALLLTMPVALAMLLPRLAWLAAPLTLAATAVATWWEFPLMETLFAGGLAGPDAWHLVAINSFSIGWVVLITGMLRLGGYRLTTPVGQSIAATA